MKLLISGYYGFGNAGDELILHSIIQTARSFSKDISITVLSNAPGLTARAYGVNAVNRWSFIQVLKAVITCDTLLTGGGGLFQDITGSLSIYYYLAIMAVARLLGKKSIIYAAGINKLKPLNAFFASLTLNSADDISVREIFSYNFLLSHGCASKKVVLTTDPVILNEPAPRIINESNPAIAIILRPSPKGSWQAETFARLADSLSQKLSANIVFIPFHKGTDTRFEQDVRKLMSSKSTIMEWEHAGDLFRIFDGLDFVVSQRLHGLILASLYNIPMAGISDDMKITHFLDELKQENLFDRTLPETDKLVSSVVNVWEQRNELRKLLPEQLKILRGRAGGLLRPNIFL